MLKWQFQMIRLSDPGFSCNSFKDLEAVQELDENAVACKNLKMPLNLILALLRQQLQV